MKIELKDGGFALVDSEDFDWLNKWEWINHSGYAARRKGGRVRFMHREIIKPPQGFQIDHVNRDKLDNRRINLRIATASQNAANSPKRAAVFTSLYKGVSKHKNAWLAKIKTKDKDLPIGNFENERDAALAYDCLARKLFGEFAYLNFPDVLVDETWIEEKKNRNTSSYLSVFFHRGKWWASVKAEGKFHRKSFDDEISAAKHADVLMAIYRPDLPPNFQAQT